MQTSFEILGSAGPFVSNLSWFAVRECQREMADAVESAIQTNQVALLESGTGTGKTFAYLVPPLANGKKTVISTRTKHLQEQLYRKDIPAVCETLDIAPTVRILKGRSNYLCLYRCDNASKQPDLFEHHRKVNEVYEWVLERGDGDISEYKLRDKERQSMTTTADTCIGRQCEFWNDCYVNKARQAATIADVLVVNHSLLSLLLNPVSGDDSGILQGVDVVVVDEAHRFPEIAAQSLGLSVSKERLDKFCTNLESAAQVSDLNPVVVAKITGTLSQAAKTMKRAIGDDNAELSLAEFEERSDLVKRYWEIVAALDEAVRELEPLVESSREVELCRDQVCEIASDARTIFERDSSEVASWCETSTQGFSLHRLPLEPGKVYGPLISEFEGSWIFTSATLSVGMDFSYFEKSMGLSDSITSRWDSPFDFARQTLLYAPEKMPQPNHLSRDEYDRRVAEVVEKIVPLTKGRVLALFTSASSMKAVREHLSDRIDYTLLCQYEQPNTRLLQEFKRDGNAVLLGTMGFWEGVDVKGDALVCVVIDKLPFAPFNTPKERARRSHLEDNGLNFFTDWQLPNAVLTLKQGSGRLIRDVEDRGMLILCDPRVFGKSYGKAFLESLPPMPQSSSLEKVNEFFSG